MKLRIGPRLYLSIGSVIVIFSVVMIFFLIRLNSLNELQMQSSKRMIDVAQVQETAGMGDRLKYIVSYTLLFRNNSESRKEWKLLKQESEANLDEIEKTIIESEELGHVQDVRVEFAEFIDLYENKILPEIAVTDGLSDKLLQYERQSEELTDKIGSDILSIVDFIQNESKQSAAQFVAIQHQLLISSITLLIAGILFVTVIALWLARSITKPLKQIIDAADTLALGDLNIEIEYRSHDELGQLAESFRRMLESLRIKVDAVQEFAKGNLTLNIQEASDRDTLAYAMADMRNQLRRLSEEMAKMYAEQKAGDIEYYIDSTLFDGAYAEVCEGYNKAVKLHVDNILIFLTLIGKYSEGDFSEKLQPMPGKQVIANEMMDKLRDNLLRVTRDTNTLITAALEGDLSARADISRHAGEFKTIVEGINKTLDEVTAPISEAQSVLEKMAAGDLSATMEGDYKGDHAAIKKALNSSLDALNKLLLQVTTAAEQVNSGATQVSSASQSLSQGATEQAASLEEVSSSITEVGGQTRQNAENALQANQLAVSARKSADEGNAHMSGMLTAMSEINTKSAEIQKIIKAIDEIAFQTNLLALNAAVEAARAGVHGKGFAVVAEEVRNLAQRSAKAAKETTDLIDGNVAAVENGSKIADQTAKALQEITEGVTKVTDLVNEIAAASREQTTAVDQIGEALGQIDQVTQANTANAEESAAAAEELSGQSMQLTEMLRRFRLAGGEEESGHYSSGRIGFGGSEENGSHEKRQASRPQLKGLEVTAEESISLDDADFGDF